MNWINLVLLLLIGINQYNETCGEQNNEAKEVEASNLTATNEPKLNILREQLEESLNLKLPEVTSQSKDEVKQINKQIIDAVSKHTYSNTNFRPPDENILKLKDQNVESGSKLSAPSPPSSMNPSEIEITHNIIEANIKWDFPNQPSNFTIWHPSLFTTTNLNRELLKLNFIKQNFNFNYQNFTHITIWKLIKMNLTNNLLVGLRTNYTNNGGSQLILITEIGFNFTFAKLIEFPKIVNAFDVIRIGLNKYLVTIENDTFINFYNVVAIDESYELEKINEINLHKQILHMKLFTKHQNKIRLFFVTEYDGRFSADLYEFDMQTAFNFWLIKSIPLATGCTSIAVLDTGRDYIVAFPQMNEVVVYQYENEMFTQLDSIETDLVTDVSGFSMGGYSYLAVGGQKPQILQYYRGQLYPQSILSQSFGLVENWFPISARTHRDDLLLLVQHRVSFSTHSLSELQALVWDGEAFNFMPTTPCYRNGVVSHHGITCMIDIEQETDITGSVIIQHGKNISILVPRGEEASRLYDLNIELVPVPNPLQKDIDEFNSIYHTLLVLVDNFESSIKQIQNTIDAAVNPDEYTVIPANWEIETVEFENTVVDKNTKIGAAQVGDLPISKEESEFYLPFMEDILDEALKKFDELNVRAKRQEDIPEANIQFEFLNGIPAGELLFATEEDTIELNGIQEFERTIHVGNDVIMGNDSKVNGISIREDTINYKSDIILQSVECDEVEISGNLLVNDINGREFNQENMGRLLDDGTARNTLIVEDMVVGGDLNFTRINEVDFEQFWNKIVFTNLPTEIEKLNVDGNILVQSEFGVTNLNEIPFPSGFVFRNSTSQQDIIRGHKVFTQALATNEIDTDGEINGIRPSQLVTLGDDQFIPGEITLSHVEVTESLEVNGTIKGENLDTFMTNPTMKQTNVINSSCIFTELEVDGNVYLTEIENLNLDTILENVVYASQSEEFIRINALKIFDTVYIETDQFTVTSNILNNKFSLDNYVTKLKNQTLNISYLNGTMNFGIIELTGLFNGINVTELDLNSIKTGGDQYIDKRIKFEHPIRAQSLKILENINNNSIHQLINIKHGENILIDSNFEIENLEIDHLHTNANIESKNGEVNNINLNEFNKTRFSLSRPQLIRGTFLIKSATIDGDLNPTFLNDMSMANVNEIIENRKNTISNIFAGKVAIKNLIVNGNVTINNVNGYNMDKVIQNVIWLDRPITLSNRLIFLDKIVIHGDLEVLSQVNTKYNLNTILKHLVYRDQPIEISERKVFTQGIKIFGDYATEYINDIKISNLLLSNNLNHVRNNIIINGNLQVTNLNAPYINDLELTELTSIYHFDEATKTHCLNIDNVEFASPQKASQLYVNGSINDIFNADEFLQNIVQTNRPIHFDGNLKVFQNNVLFTQNMVVDRFNSIDLENYFTHVVHVDEKDPIIINNKIEFVDEITVNQLWIGGDLITNTILQYDPSYWLNNLLINENIHVRIPLIFERGTFLATAMSVNFLNDIDLSKVLTYNTEQVFEDDFQVSEIVSFVPVQVDGLVNNISFPVEEQNTLMITGNTTIKIPLQINNLNVYGAVKTPPFINGKSLTDIFKIEPNMIVSDSMSFQEIQTDSIIDNQHNISDIDFEHWYMESLWKRGRETQTVLSNYTISNVTVGEGGIHGTGLINNKPMNEIVETRNRDELKLSNEVLAYGKEVEFICMNLRNSIYLSQQQIYYVKYFDDRIILDNGISKIVTKLFFEFNHVTYLLVSGGDCHTTIYRWDAKNIDFEEVLKFQTGFVSEWGQIHGESANDTVLVSHSMAKGFNCVEKGVYMWRFNGHSIFGNTAVLLDPEYEIKSLWTSDKFINALFLITEGINREPNVFQIDENGRIENHWKLPINHRQLQFLPTELIFYLALSDGSQIFLLNNYKIYGKREKRQNLDILTNMIKPWQDVLLRNDIFKFSAKSVKSLQQEIFDLDETKNTGKSVERIIDNIFEKITKVSDKTVRKDYIESRDVGSTPKNLAEIIADDIVSLTLGSLAKIEKAKLIIANDDEVVGDLVGIPKKDLVKAIDIGYPHVKNITKSYVLVGEDALTNLDKIADFEILNYPPEDAIYEGYKSVEKSTNILIDSPVNTLSQLDQLVKKFELNNDIHSSEVLNINVRDTTTLNNVVNTTQNNSTVGTPLNPAYTNIKKIGKVLLETDIKSIVNKVNQTESIGNLSSVDSTSDESVAAPNPSYTTQMSETSSKRTENGNNDRENVEDRSNIELDTKSLNNAGNTTQNNSMVGTTLDRAYTEIEKIGKVLVDTGIKAVADSEDLKDRINHPLIPSTTTFTPETSSKAITEDRIIYPGNTTDSPTIYYTSDAPVTTPNPNNTTHNSETFSKPTEDGINHPSKSSSTTHTPEASSKAITEDKINHPGNIEISTILPENSQDPPHIISASNESVTTLNPTLTPETSPKPSEDGINHPSKPGSTTNTSEAWSKAITEDRINHPGNIEISTILPEHFQDPPNINSASDESVTTPNPNHPTLTPETSPKPTEDGINHTPIPSTTTHTPETSSKAITEDRIIHSENTHDPPNIDSASDESVTTPNPTLTPETSPKPTEDGINHTPILSTTTHTPETSSKAITEDRIIHSENAHDPPNIDSASDEPKNTPSSNNTTHMPQTLSKPTADGINHPENIEDASKIKLDSKPLNNSITQNNSMVGTPFDTAITTIKKIGKAMLETGIKTIVDTVNQSESVGDPLNIDSVSDEFVSLMPETSSKPTEDGINHQEVIEDRSKIELDTKPLNNVGSTTQNNSVVGTTLDKAYTQIENIGKVVVDTGIKDVADIEDITDRINHPTIPSSTTLTPETSSKSITEDSIINPENTQNPANIDSTSDEPVTTLNSNSTTHLPETSSKPTEDGINHPENTQDPAITVSASDESVTTPTPNDTTFTPETSPKAITPSDHILGTTLFNSFGHSYIGDKQSKISGPHTTKESHDNFDFTIGQEINYNGVIASENSHIPEKGTGEIVVLHVGNIENRRKLTAISTKTNASTIPGKHDTIKIYDDIMEGKIYQEIHASKPTGLTAIHIGDQTMLAFLEDKAIIQLFIYHGIEGFKNVNELKLPDVASDLSTIILPRYGPYSCPRYFLVVTLPNKLWFLEAIMEGNCGVIADLDCTLPLHSVNNN